MVERVVSTLHRKSDAEVRFLSDQFRNPEVLPIACFDLPLKYKKMLLFGDVGVCVFVDRRRLAETLSRHGLKSTVARNRSEGLVRTKVPNLASAIVVGWGILDRLVYEFLSVDTIINYTRARWERK